MSHMYAAHMYAAHMYAAHMHIHTILTIVTGTPYIIETWSLSG